MSEGVRIVGLDHVQIAIPAGGEEAARAFYGGVLGMREVPKPGPLGGRGGCWFEAAGVGIHLGVEAGFRPAAKAHPTFRVADLEACRAALSASGATVVPDDSVPGVRRLYAFDPFGNRLELIQAGDEFPAAGEVGRADEAAATAAQSRLRGLLRLGRRLGAEKLVSDGTLSASVLSLVSIKH